MGAADRRTFCHSALVHRTPDELAAAVVPFVADGLACGEPVMVNLAVARAERLRRELGHGAGGIVWTDADEWVVHPARRLRAIGDAVEARTAAGASHLRFVGECPFHSTVPAMVPEWLRFDAALNEVLRDVPMHMVCVYDASVLPAAVVTEALSVHPSVGIRPVQANPGFEDAWRFLARRQVTDLAVPAGAARVAGRVTPSTARRFLSRCMAEVGSTGERAGDLELVLSEIVTNSWQAGATTVTVSCWSTGAGVAVQVDDDGPGLWDVLAGYRRPSVDATGGRGLWITRQLADVVDICPSRSGTAVRVQMLTGLAEADERSPWSGL